MNRNDIKNTRPGTLKETAPEKVVAFILSKSKVLKTRRDARFALILSLTVNTGQKARCQRVVSFTASSESKCLIIIIKISLSLIVGQTLCYVCNGTGYSLKSNDSRRQQNKRECGNDNIINIL